MSVNTGFRELNSKEPKRAEISLTANGTLVEAVPGKRICVVSLALSASGAGNVEFLSESNDLGTVQFKAADPTLVLGHNPDGWLQTAEGKALKVGNPSSLTLTGFLTYVEI